MVAIDSLAVWPDLDLRVEPADRGIRLGAGPRSVVIGPQQLRHLTTEPDQVDPCTRQRLFTPVEISPELVVRACDLLDGVVAVEFSDGHRTRLPIERLVQAIGWVADDDAPPDPVPWTGSPTGDVVADWRPIGWSADEGDLNALVAALDGFARNGFVVLTDLPTAPDTVRRVGERLGHLVGQNFGSVFDVRGEVNPTDLAYTDLGLAAHTDQPYRHPPPCIQLLHCVLDEASGGDSTVVDGRAAWAAMAAAEPDLWRAMHDVEVAFRYDIGSDVVVDRGHIFEVDRRDRFRRIRFSTRLDAPVGSGPDIERWYLGRRWLAAWFDDPSNRLAFRLRAGDLLMVDNHRVLHGRTPFDGASGRRHLQGCYIEHDGPNTIYRLARRELARRGLEERHERCGGPE